MNQLEKARRVLRHKIRREPTVRELADRTDLPVAKVQLLLSARTTPSSLDMPMGDDTPLEAFLKLEAPRPKIWLSRAICSLKSDAIWRSCSSESARLSASVMESARTASTRSKRSVAASL